MEKSRLNRQKIIFKANDTRNILGSKNSFHFESKNNNTETITTSDVDVNIK